MEAETIAKLLFRFFESPADLSTQQAERFARDSVFEFSILSKAKTAGIPAEGEETAISAPGAEEAKEKDHGYVLVVKTREKFAFSREIEGLIPNDMLGGIEKSVTTSPEQTDGRKVFDVIVLRSESQDDLRSLQRQLLNLRVVPRSAEEPVR